MLPGNKGERYGRECAENLRDQDDAFATESIRQMAGGQRQCNHRHSDDQSHEAECGRRMGARVDVPLHRHGKHETTGD